MQNGTPKGGSSRGSFNPMDSGYVPVNKRIEEFYEKYPDGAIRSEIVEIQENVVIVKAMAFRHFQDEHPAGVGHSQMPIPGKNNFTRDSEVENAETSAWGRALAAMGFEVHNAVASAEEVANKQEDSSGSTTQSIFAAMPKITQQSTPASDKATAAQKQRLMTVGKKLFGDEDAVRRFVWQTVMKNKAADLTKNDMIILFEKMDKIESQLDAAVAVASE